MEAEKLIKSITSMCDFWNITYMQVNNGRVNYDQISPFIRLKYRYNNMYSLMFTSTRLGHSDIYIYTNKTYASDEVVAVAVCNASETLLSSCAKLGNLFYGFKFKEIEKQEGTRNDYYIYF